MTDIAPPVSYDLTDHVATLTIARPDAMNSFDLATKVALRDLIHEVASNDAVRCVVLTGSGRAFSAGQDLKEHVAALNSASGPLSTTVEDHFNPMVTAIRSMPKPVVAAVNGVAAGAGASLALAADFRLMADTAGFNTAFAAIALSCDTGVSWTLQRLVGAAKAADLLMLPRTVKADEARELGLVTEVVPADELGGAVHRFAARLASGPTLAYASIKRALAFSATHDLAESLSNEARLMAITGASQDHRAAVDAFLAKTPPEFHGR